jgi:type II secretory pathway pseudopilin PulG
MRSRTESSARWAPHRPEGPVPRVLPGSRPRGFTLIEGLVTLVIVMVLVIGLLTLLDSSNRLAKQETQVADAQGSGRSAIYEVTRLVRQARVGHLSPLSSVMPFVNNATNETITAGTVTHTLRPGTDAIQLRGVLFGDSYFFNTGDVVCAGGPCTGEGSATVTVQQVTATGFQNFAAGQLPTIASRTEPFFFVVSDTSSQPLVVTVAGVPATYAIPRYYVGRVDANAAGTWYVHDGTATPQTFRFTVDFTDVTGRTMNASTAVADALERPFSGGVVDEIVLFVDRGPQDPAALGSGYAHPFLAQAIRRGDGSWEVQRLIDDVEDLQFAYGLDGLDGSTPDRGIDPVAVSATKDADEWAFNVDGETLTESASPRRFEEFLVGPAFVPTSPIQPAAATPALRAVFVAVVTKSLDADSKFAGPGALGVKTFDSAAQPVSTQPHRRRVQTMAVSLRNFS